MPSARCFYVEELSQILTIELLGRSVSAYNRNLVKVVDFVACRPESKEPLEIVDITYAPRYLRVGPNNQLGACVKENSLYFWDVNLTNHGAIEFNLERYTREPQLGIWYLDLADKWTSADRHCNLSFWDIPNQTLIGQIKVPAHSENCKVLEITGMSHLRLIVVATNEQAFYLYSLADMKIYTRLKMEGVGFNSMKYCEKLQVLLVTGCENIVKVFSFSPQFEAQSIGRLVGHSGIVEAVEVIGDSTMAATVDDKGIAKLWDLRKLACIQTVILGNKSNIRSILYMSNQDKLAFVGDRIHSLMFEPDPTQSKVKEQPVPLAFDISEDTGYLYIATKSEVRVVSIEDGRVKHVFENLLDHEQSDELTCFKFLPKTSGFLLGDLSGRLGHFAALSGAPIRKTQAHNGAITSLAIDSENDTLLTTGSDGKMILLVDVADLPEDQPDEVDDAEEREEFFSKPIMHDANIFSIIETYNKEEEMEKTNKATETARNRLVKIDKLKSVRDKNALDKLRSVERANNDTEVALAELSVYHNLVALATQYQRVYLYNYENFRPISILEMQQDEEITALAFLTGYSKLAISTSQGLVLITSILFSTNHSVEVVLDMRIDIRSCTYIDELSKKSICSGYGNKLLSDITLMESARKESKSLNNIADSKSLMKTCDHLSLKSAAFYVGENSGVICVLNLEEFLNNQPKYQPYSVNPTYNSFRRVQENFAKFASALEEKRINLSSVEPTMQSTKLTTLIKKCFKVAREALTHVVLKKSNERLLFVTSQDCTFRVFTEAGQMLCHLNLNHPLPILWNLTSEKLINKTASTVFALKTIELMSQRYAQRQRRLPLTIRKVLDIYGPTHQFTTFNMTSIDHESRTIGRSPTNAGLKKKDSETMLLEEKPVQSTAKDKARAGTEQPLKSKTMLGKAIIASNILVMKDVFTPKDLFFDKIKTQNRDEIQGPSLRQLETIRKAKNILKTYDPLYGKTENEAPVVTKEEDDLEKLLKPRVKQPFIEYHDTFESERRWNAAKKTFAAQTVNKLSGFDEFLDQQREVQLSKKEGSMLESTPKNIHVQITDLKKRMAKNGSTPKPFFSSRVHFEPTTRSVQNPLPLIEPTFGDMTQRSKIDIFDYAHERRLFTEESKSALDMFKSKILHDSSHITSSSRNIFNYERRQEQHKFQGLLRELDKKKLKAKASTVSVQNESKFSHGAYNDAESTIAPPSLISQQLQLRLDSLPRLKR